MKLDSFTRKLKVQQGTLYTLDAVEDSLESLYAKHGKQRTWVGWIFLIIVLGVVVALPLVRVDVTVGAPAVVRPALERVIVQATTAGYIAELGVKDNQEVKSGEVLVVLKSRALEEQISQNRRRQSENDELRSDLALMISGAQQASAASSHEVPDAIGLSRDNAEFSLRIPHCRWQYEHFLSELKVLQARRVKAKREPGVALSASEARTAEETNASNGGETIESINAERRRVVAMHLTKWEADRTACDSKRMDLEAEAAQLREQKELYVLAAPIAGTAVGFGGLSVGTYLPAGAKLGEISPGGPLIVEAMVRPKDVGFVEIGQRAKIQIDAYPHAYWGTLAGRVTNLSHDVHQVGQYNVFKVTVTLEGTTLHSSTGMSVQVTKGMTGAARLVVANRSLLQLIQQTKMQWLER